MHTKHTTSIKTLTWMKYQKWGSYCDNACRHVGRLDIREIE